MAETRTIHDPFENKTVEIRNDLVLRLRGKYATGPTLPNGEPEFGWRQFDTPPIQHEAAAEIEQLHRIRALLIKALAAATDTHDDNPEMLEAPLTFAIKRRNALTNGERA